MNIRDQKLMKLLRKISNSQVKPRSPKQLEVLQQRIGKSMEKKNWKKILLIIK